MKIWKISKLAPVFVLGLALTACGEMGAVEVDPQVQTLADRAEIEDLITRYYYNLGHSSADSFSQFYAEDAEMVLGETIFEGREGIEGAYQGTADSPQRLAEAFNISISNLLVEVDGDTARARMIFTEHLTENAGDPPAVYVQGREYDDLVKVDGVWKFKRRQIMGGDGVPEGW